VLSHTYLPQHVMGKKTDSKEWGINPPSTTPPSLKHAFYLLVFKFYKRSDHHQTCPGAKIIHRYNMIYCTEREIISWEGTHTHTPHSLKLGV